MTLANRNRLAARLPADYADFGYAPIFADDMNALAGVAVDVELQKLSAALSDNQTAANRVQTALSVTAASSAASSAAANVAITLDQSVGERANDSSIWTMTRSTPTWGFGISGDLEETAVDTASWEFDPITLAPLGMAFAGTRTNVVTNPRAEGAVAGTPGTVPTGWGTRPSGCTSEIVGATTINGIPGLLFRLVGIPTTTSPQAWALSASNTCTIGDYICTSGYFALIAGSMANISSFALRGNSSDAGSSISNTWTSVPTRTTRRWISSTGTGMQPVLRWAFLDTVTPVDITIFIGGLQQEIAKPFESPLILPPVGVPGASTRTQGSVSIPITELGSRYNYRQGTLIVDWNSQSGAFTSAVDTEFFGIISLGDLTANEVMGLVMTPAHTGALFRRTVGGVGKSSATLTITAPAAGETVRFAMAWDADAGLMQVAARRAASTQLINQFDIPIITHLMPGRFSTTRPLFGNILGVEIRPTAVWGSTLSALT